MDTSLSGQLAEAASEDRRHTALVVRAGYRPVGSPSSTVMPPTFPVDDRERDLTKKYLVADRLVDGERRLTVVLDQEQSQANRIEEALRDARDAGRLQLPIFELRVRTSHGGVRLTSLDFPHRYADAYLRDSTINGTRFDQSPPGQRLRTVSADDVRPLYEREPVSLIMGAWDSHRKGRWPKFARLFTATMFGVDPVFGVRRGGRLDPENLTGAVDDKSRAEGAWSYVPQGAKARGQKLSEIGHGNIAPNPVPGGVTVLAIHRIASMSFAGLERLRFGDAPTEAAILARAALAALALAGDRLAFGRPSAWLRSGCDLAKATETIGLERPGGELDVLEVTVQQALDAFHELREQAAARGIVMDSDVIAVEPVPALREAIEFAVAHAAADGE